ncbi:PREDICTED: uncharacterized protein LOC107162203 [Diuraphis noxia]|uniref:uncharacterized protein LOC107162203 n=1 Tax=Diuraphis noxia TaxID=143948 RepID=UPI0007637ADE|nr:PREDICTED: uncharacterized protein LOC107162203 [Diuraphis noxia]XP_015364478.1 PREDICTED: uncharacterized protein LOC107162203 [Diuraphis noxia]XP_015364479.1 PREDICTED: uncharacterized protein LOC107162203 [Diuraphis noxia]
MEQNSIVEAYENALDDQVDVEMKHQYIKDNKCKEEKQESPVCLNELTEKWYDTKDEPWEINVHNSNANNEYVSTGDVMQSQLLKSDPSYENTSEIEIIPESNNVFDHRFEAEHHFEFDFKHTEDFDLSYDENNIISNGFSDSLYTDNFYCSLYSTSLSSPNISHFSCLPETKEDIEDFETLSLENSNLINDTLECDLLQYVLDNIKFEDNDRVYKNSECFIGNRIISNPDIMYNIELRLHLKKMQLFAEQISKTPSDLTVLNKCMELMSIPKMKKGQQITEKCGSLSEDSGLNYNDNQHMDRNKIIVNQVAEHSHTEFDFTSKDTLFVLNDQSIDDIKRLADIMKNNFDIQSKSSTMISIDPIQNRLQEIGLKVDMMELIKNYENDVFSRRKRLLKEYEHYKLLINQFVKRELSTSTVKNKYDTQEFFVEEQSTSKISALGKNLFTEEKTSISAESKHINNIDTVTIKSENIKTNTADIHDRKMYSTKSLNTDVQFNDLLKCSHMVSISSNSKSNSYMNTKPFLSTDSLSKQKNKTKNILLKNEKQFDVSKTVNMFGATKNINIDKSKIQSTSTLNKTIPNCVKSIGFDQASFQKIIDEFKGNFNDESNNNPDINNAIDRENYSDNL